MRAQKLAIAVTVIAVVTLGPGCNPDKNKLFFKPQQGATRIVDTEEARNMTMNIMGMSMNIGTSMDYTFDMTTKSIDELGNSTIDVTFKSVKYDMTGLDAMLGGGGPGAAGMPAMPGMPKGDDPLGIKSVKTALKSAEGQSFTVTVSKLGEVTEVSGADAIAEKASSAYKLPALAGPVSSKQVLTLVIGDEAMKKTMESIFNTRPDKKLNAGDTWQDKTSGGDTMLTMTQDRTLTVKERAGGMVNVESAAKIDMTPAADMVKQLGQMPGFKMELSGQGSGTYKFDEATGWLVDGVAMAPKISGSVSMSAPQMGNMSIPIEAAYKMSVKSYPS
jgi:hypothetical protein